MKVLCFIASLTAGGSERQMIELIKVLHSEGMDVDLLTYAGTDQYECPEYVKRHHVNCKYKALLPFYLVCKICSIRYDSCISFLTKNNIIACVAKLFAPHRQLIVGERNCSSQMNRTKRVAYLLYKFADYVVPNSVSEAEYIKRNAPWLEKKTIPILYNFIRPKISAAFPKGKVKIAEPKR